MGFVFARAVGVDRHVQWTLMSVNSVPVSIPRAAKTRWETTAATALKVIQCVVNIIIVNSALVSTPRSAKNARNAPNVIQF